MKDPAFLFYSKDFYEGTRIMLPKERACYIDLMIYQHQNGPIPDDPERVLLYCSGIDKATLEATLKAKFNRTDKGWINKKLEEVIEKRVEYSHKQSINGVIGQFWKRAKANLADNEYLNLQKILKDKSKDELHDSIQKVSDPNIDYKAMLEALLKHLAIENAIANGNIEIESGNRGVGEEDEYMPDKLSEKLKAKSEPYAISIRNVVAGIADISISEVWEYVDLFTEEEKASGSPPRTLRQYQSHFKNWIKKELRDKAKQKPKYGNSKNIGSPVPAKGNYQSTIQPADESS